MNELDNKQYKEINTGPYSRTNIKDYAELKLALTANQQILLQQLYLSRVLTKDMKTVIIKPLNSVIEKQPSPQNQPTNSRPTNPEDIIQEWLENKKDFSYNQLRQFLSKNGFDNNTTSLALRIFLLRFINQYHPYFTLDNLPENLAIKDEDSLKKAAYDAVSSSKENFEDLNSPPTQKPIEEFNEEEKIFYEETLERLKKTQVLINIISINPDLIENISNIFRAKTSKELDIAVRQSLSSLNPEIKDYVKPIIDNIKNKKLEEFERISSKLPTNEELKKRIEELANTLNTNLKPALEYLISLTSDNVKNLLKNAPKYVLELVNKLRLMTPNVANTELLAFFWWHLRLGGERSRYLRNILSNKYPDFARKLERYFNYLFDHLLSSEAAGFELEKEIPFDQNQSPNLLIFQTIKNLIKYHIPQDQDKLRFTLLDGENRVLKITINYQSDLTDEEILNRINSSLTNAQWQDLELTEEQRLSISYDGQHSKKRQKNKDYQNVYYNFGENEETKTPYQGDYLIQIGSVYDDTRDPRSLFAVNSHQIAIRLAFKKAGKTKITARFNHQFFDGLPALTHFQKLINDLQIPINLTTNRPNFFRNEKRTFEDHYEKNVSNASKKDNLSHPLIEGVYQYSLELQPDQIEKIKQLSDLGFISNLQIAIAKANHLEYFQFLFAGKDLAELSKINQNLSNVQPVAVAFDTNGKIINLDQLKGSIERAKNGVGDVAYVSAISGTKELPLSIAGQLLNPSLVKILRHSQGMTSVLTSKDDGISFSTAFSDAYTPETIDLNNPTPHIGIVGINSVRLDNGQTKIILKVRILPSQAQIYFRDAILEEIKRQTDNETLHYQSEKIVQVYKAFNPLLQALNKLVEGSGGKYISYESYQKIRRKTLEQLKNLGIFKDFSEEDFQDFLNQSLQLAARRVISNFVEFISSKK